MASDYSTLSLLGRLDSQVIRSGCRSRRMDFFLSLVRDLPAPVKILDVGGEPQFWNFSERGRLRITLLNRYEQSAPGFRCVTGDACDLSRFADGSFDVAFSSSTINLVGDWNRQRAMARELQRVGRRYFVQVPNYWFPVDWQTLLPAFHWLPGAVRIALFRTFEINHIPRSLDRSNALARVTGRRDLTHKQLRRLFPGATIVSEKVAGFAKSFMTYGGFDHCCEPPVMATAPAFREL